jgi:hypothetical protein
VPLLFFVDAKSCKCLTVSVFIFLFVVSFKIQFMKTITSQSFRPLFCQKDFLLTLFLFSAKTEIDKLNWAPYRFGDPLKTSAVIS